MLHHHHIITSVSDPGDAIATGSFVRGFWCKAANAQTALETLRLQAKHIWYPSKMIMQRHELFKFDSCHRSHTTCFRPSCRVLCFAPFCFRALQGILPITIFGGPPSLLGQQVACQVHGHLLAKFNPEGWPDSAACLELFSHFRLQKFVSMCV